MSIKRIIICLVICFTLLFVCMGYLIYEINCTHGIYEIDISAKCISNNSVGNEWSISYISDGKAISNGERITAPLNPLIKKTITVNITERDKHSDRASGDITFTVRNGENKKTLITVIENNGRFKGNIAKWEITVSLKLVKKTSPVFPQGL